MHHTQVHPKVGTHKQEVPVGADQMDSPGIFKTETCGQEPGHGKAADHDQNTAYGYSKINHKLKKTVRIIFSFQKRSVPPAMEHSVDNPQHQHHHSQALMHPVIGKKDCPTHQYDGKDCHCNINRHIHSLSYSLPLTGSHQVVLTSSPGTSMARWLNQLSLAAPCQCFTPAGIFITEPGTRATAALPSS